MAAVTEDDNPGQLPVPGEEAADATASGELAGEAGDQDGAAQSDEPDPRAEPADAAAAPGVDEDEAPDADEDEAPDADEDGEAPEPSRDVADLEQESEIAADYVEGLLDVADLDGDIDMDVEGDRALVSVVGATLQELVGPRGEVLEALQELTRLAVHRQTGVRTRIMLDVGGYRARRRMELTALGRDAAEDVGRTGVARRLDPMTPFERKIIHDAVAAAGLRSESEGEEPNRRVVVLPAG
jgi:spoIIIJ-associated protein